MKFSNKRIRAVAAPAPPWLWSPASASASPAPRTAASARYVTATAAPATSPRPTPPPARSPARTPPTAAFTVDGTVKTVDVAVGDAVDAGDVLATLKKGPLQLAVLNAETAVAQAKASLYAAKHPSRPVRAGRSRLAAQRLGQSVPGGSGGRAVPAARRSRSTRPC